MSQNKNAQQGFNLIELMVALLIGIIILLTATIITVHFAVSNRLMLQTNKMTGTLQQVLTLITNDLQRAGYDGTIGSNLYGTSNPNSFTQNGTKVQVPSSTCVIFSYDRDNNGSINSSGTTSLLTNEHFGYRLSNHTIQALVVDSGANNSSCSDAANSTNWINLTDPNQITVNAFTATLTLTTAATFGGTHSTTSQLITLTLQGQIPNQSNVSTTLSKTVKVQNDLVV